MVRVRIMERASVCNKCKCPVLKGEPMVGWPAKFGPAKWCKICGIKYLASLLVELATLGQQKPTVKEQTTLTEKCLNGIHSSRKSEKSSEQKSPCQEPSKVGKRKKVRSSAKNVDL